MPNGHVLMNDQPLHGKLARFIEKKIGQWAEHHSADGSDPEFTVTFSDADEDAARNARVKRVECMTEINWNGRTYRGCDLAADTQSAFIHSLKRLHPH